MDFGFPAAVCIACLWGDGAFLLQCLAVCMLHEAGHGLAMWLTRAGIREIRFQAAGLQMITTTACLPRLQQLCISLSGPAVNLLLAALLYRYAKAQGFGFEGLWSYELTFADTEEISDWAIEAISWMNMQDLIRGRENNQLAPKATATRAEIANLFQRFAALVEGEEIA